MSAAAANLRLLVSARDGVVGGVEVVSPRADLSPLFVGSLPEEAAVLAGRLFSLCPMAQSLAVRAAGEAARNIAIDEAEHRARAIRLLCERLAEMLRASVLDWPGDGPPATANIVYLRDALRLLRVLPEASDALELLKPLREATDGLGVGAPDDAERFLGARLADALADEPGWALAAETPDHLVADDDAAVWRAMTRDPDFSRAPSLPSRCAETGAAARRGGRNGAVAARLAARCDDMAAALGSIEDMLNGAKAPGDLCRAAGEGQGFAAVESARGRLYHAMRLDGAGRIAAYRIVAPTEWNFHPEGPFVRALRGARIGMGAQAKRRVERLAFVFDPCVRAVAEISDRSHA
jgi:uptake hydrogenase large subunit